MIILGINAFHGDSAAALLRDGRLVAAAEEERFRRIKHWAGFPSQAIEWCLSDQRLTISDVDVVAINQDNRAHLFRKIAYVLQHRPNLAFIVDRLKNRQRRRNVRGLLSNSFPKQTFTGQVYSIEHHMAHLSSAFYVSPFREAAVVSVDGFGDFSSAAWGVGEGHKIRIEDRVFFPHSLGIFYQAITQYLGFPHYGDEYKVMGLAPYGEPTKVCELRKILVPEPDGSFRLDLSYFVHHTMSISYEWEEGSPNIGTLFSPVLEDLLGPRRQFHETLDQRHRDIARSAQSLYEEIFFNLLNTLNARHGTDQVTLAGGCAMNSVANGKIRRQTRYKRVYVQAAAGDAGGAIGAALAVWHLHNSARTFAMDHAYWGPKAENSEIEKVVGARYSELLSENCKISKNVDEEQLCTRTAKAVADGRVVGWFQGRMEWGPRALGNRSIICDPRRSDMKAVLNEKIKRRESFRPFAPSILAEHVIEWFEEDDDVPFMMQVFQIRENMRNRVPAVCHVDGSGRLQTVWLHTNPRYYRLISEFHALTGVPMVLNTSFNENEPVVCRPEEALDCFVRTRMDVLVLENTFIERLSD